jgi:hypothetical protein
VKISLNFQLHAESSTERNLLVSDYAGAGDFCCVSSGLRRYACPVFLKSKLTQPRGRTGRSISQSGRRSSLMRRRRRGAKSMSSGFSSTQSACLEIQSQPTGSRDLMLYSDVNIHGFILGTCIINCCRTLFS